MSANCATDVVLRGIIHGAVDYLLKPVDAARLKKAIERARAQRNASLAESRVDNGIGRVALPTRRGVRLVDPHDLACATFDGTALTVHRPVSPYAVVVVLYPCSCTVLSKEELAVDKTESMLLAVPVVVTRAVCDYYFHRTTPVVAGRCVGT